VNEVAIAAKIKISGESLESEKKKTVIKKLLGFFKNYMVASNYYPKRKLLQV